MEDDTEITAMRQSAVMASNCCSTPDLKFNHCSRCSAIQHEFVQSHANHEVVIFSEISSIPKNEFKSHVTKDESAFHYFAKHARLLHGWFFKLESRIQAVLQVGILNRGCEWGARECSLLEEPRQNIKRKQKDGWFVNTIICLESNIT